MQSFVVIEIQTNNDGVTSVLPTAYEDENTAWQKFYTILSAASVSALPFHRAVILNHGNSNPEGWNSNFVMDQKVFRHGSESEQA